MKGYDNIFDLKTQIYSLSESRIFADDADDADFKRVLLVRSVTCQNQDLLDWRIFRIVDFAGTVAFAKLKIETKYF